MEENDVDGKTLLALSPSKLEQVRLWFQIHLVEANVVQCLGGFWK